MQDVERYEILILGSGEAGKYLAWTMAKAGHRTAMVERKHLGGSCPNIACLPSKNLIYSAKIASLARRGAEFGLEIDSLSVNMADVQRRKRIMVEGLHQMHVDRQAASGGELIMGNARFVAPRTVEVALNDGGTRTVFADRVILALGSRATMPNVPGLSAAQPMTHVEALELDRVPEHLMVMGGGYVGLELAQAMRRFGSQVSVIEAAPQLASREDPDVGAALLELFRDEGIDVSLETHVSRVEGRSGQKIRIHAKDQDGERMQTTAAHIWAMGDCAGSPQFTHVAFDDFRVVYDNLNGGNRTTKNRLVPFCMFTDPELARVGRNESEARRDGIEYRMAKMRTADVLRTRTVSEPRGFLKVLIGANSDEILGFTAFGFEASEPMAAVQTAMIGRMPYTMLHDAIFTHPTMSEGLIALMASVPAKSTQRAA